MLAGLLACGYAKFDSDGLSHELGLATAGEVYDSAVWVGSSRFGWESFAPKERSVVHQPLAPPRPPAPRESGGVVCGWSRRVQKTTSQTPLGPPPPGVGHEHDQRHSTCPRAAFMSFFMSTRRHSVLSGAASSPASSTSSTHATRPWPHSAQLCNKPLCRSGVM